MNLEEINLFDYSDLGYREFNRKLVNTNYELIGVRIPILVKLSKDIYKRYGYRYLNDMHLNYFEDVILYGFIMSNIKDLDVFVSYFNIFVSKIDSWAITDTCISRFKIINKNKDYFKGVINGLINTKKEFYIRSAIIMLQSFYMDDINYILEVINSIDSEYYYVNMAIAWLISNIFVIDKDIIYKYLSNNNLNTFTYNKAISKILDSRRIEKTEKEYLKTLKRRH